MGDLLIRKCLDEGQRCGMNGATDAVDANSQPTARFTEERYAGATRVYLTREDAERFDAMIESGYAAVAARREKPLKDRILDFIRGK